MGFKLINDRYKIIKKIGEGGMGSIYLVSDTFRQYTYFAVKTIKSTIINDKEKRALLRFKNEFEIMTRLHHPNLTRVYDFGRDIDVGEYYIVMEYIRGETLFDIIKKNKVISSELALEIMVHLLRALEFMHSRKIIYRDIKPENIIILFDNNQKIKDLKIMDFGISDLEVSETSIVKGTLRYMAPEIFKRELVDHRADIFALGVLLYEMLTKTMFYHDFKEATVISILKDCINYEKNRSGLLSEISDKRIASIISKMTAYSIKERYSSCSEVILDINKIFKTSYQVETYKTSLAYIKGANFVKREVDMFFLMKRLERDDNKISVLSSPPGIGKSRLVEEFKKYCQIKGLQCFHSRYEEDTAQFPFYDLFSNLLYESDSKLIAEFGPRFSKFLSHKKLKSYQKNKDLVEYDVETQEKINQLTAIAFFKKFLERAKDKVVFIFEDIHNYSERCLDFLEKLIFEIDSLLAEKRAINIFLVLREYNGGKKDKVRKLQEKLRSKKMLIKHKMRPFNKEDITKYIINCLGENYIGDSIKENLEKLVSFVWGNPLFLNEYFKSLINQNILTKKSNKWEISKKLFEVGLSGRMKKIIEDNLNYLQLSKGEKKILLILSLVKTHIKLDFARSILRVDTSYLNYFIGRLLDFGIIDFFRIGKEYSFYLANKILKEFIKSEFTEEEIVNTHQLIAQTIEDNYEHLSRLEGDANIFLMAFHYSQAKNYEKSLSYNLKAINLALSRGLYEKAFYYLSIFKQELKKDDFLNLGIALSKEARILFFRGEWEKAGISVQKAITISREHNNLEVEAKSWNLYAHILIHLNMYPDAKIANGIAALYFQKNKNMKEKIKGLDNRGQVALYEKNLSLALESFETQKHLAEKSGLSKWKAKSLANLATLYLEIKDFSKASKYANQMFELVKDQRNKLELADAYYLLGSLNKAWKADNYLGFYKSFYKIAVTLNNKDRIRKYLKVEGDYYHEKADFNNALSSYKEYLALSKEIGEPKAISEGIYLISETYKDLGDLVRAEKYYKVHYDFAKEYSHKKFLVKTILGLVELNLFLKKKKEAEAYLDQIFQIIKDEEIRDLKVYVLASDYYTRVKTYDKAQFFIELAKDYLLNNQVNDLIIRSKILLLDKKIKYYQTDSEKIKEDLIYEMMDLLNNNLDNRIRGLLLKELYFMTDNESYKKQAVRIFEKLYKKFPFYKYMVYNNFLEHP